MQPRALCLGNLFRDQLDRYGELELIAERWRGAVEALPAGAALVVNGDDPQVGDLARARPARASSGSTTRGTRGRRSSTRPTRSTASRAARRTSTPRRTSATSATTAVRPAGTRGRRSTSSRASSSSRARGVVVRARHAGGHAARARFACPGLYNVYNALAAARSRSRSASSLDDVVAGLERFGAAFGRFERIEVGDRRLLMLLIKNPAGANEAIRTLVEGGAPRLAIIALNDAIADGRDVSWIWDVDFEPLLERSRRSSPPARGRQSWRCASSTRASDASGSRSCPSSARRSTAGSRSRGRRRPRRPADVHGDARAPQAHRRAGARAAVLGASAR